MIKLENVNKYFNRHKKNEIHVINNTTLSFPKTGLVAILGPSGCGKTTMLNAIGGLDNVNSGHIYVDGVRITNRFTHKIDEIRNLNIGYIFQDYKLVDNMSVFDNVAISLKLIGIKDQEEINKRVLYVLEKVGMLRYKNRPANMLSGGERQRVGIARALVKNPKIIIADEPTGNLDSKNSIEIMNIIKNISNNYLVILVTHEEELARFFATRIVELKDGIVVKDYENKEVANLNYEIESRIYLKDYKNIKKLKDDNVNINVYRNDNEKLDINVVFKNGSIYIATNNDAKVEVIENNSNIELIDDHYKEIKSNTMTEAQFDLSEVANMNYKEKYSSIYHLGSFIKYGFKKVRDYPILKKILLGGFFLSGMFIFYSVSSIFATLKIDDKDFISMNKNYLTASVKKISIEDYETYENDKNINYILPNNSLVNFVIKYDKFWQTSNYFGFINGSLSDINMIDKDNLIVGRMPNNSQEIVIDKMVIDNFIETNNSKTVGFASEVDFLNHTVSINNLDDFLIVGISNNEEPNIYVDNKLFINIIANNKDRDSMENFEKEFIDYKLLNNKKIKIVKGREPSNDYEVIVNKNNELEMPLNSNIDIKINEHKLKVVGYYENIENNYYDDYLVNNVMIEYNLISNASNLSIFSKDKNKTLELFRNKQINIKDSYEYAKDEYLKGVHNSMVSTLIISGIILGISLIEILLMMRSSFLSRIKEVGIYRAIGIKKSDIYKMFSGEILAITIIASFLGITFMTYILYGLSKISLLDGMFLVNAWTYLISLALVLIFNLIVGLLPVYNTIRKTPASILARFDVD